MDVIEKSTASLPETSISDDRAHTDSSAPKKRRRRLGDRRDGRRLRTLPPINYLIPFFMKRRSDAQNTFEDTIEISALEEFIKRKQEEGYPGMSILHCVIASYVRTVAQRPGVNRFIAGQHIYSRNNIIGIMTVKKKMALDGEETETKVVYDPSDGVEDVYRKFNEQVEKAKNAESPFGKSIRIMAYIPGLLLRFTIGLIQFFDYFGLLPKRWTEELSPFHGSFVITSMGSLGIHAIYHHLYDFGNVPVFISYGKKYSVMELDDDGHPVKRKYMSFKVVTDERICDGYYYASAFKIIKRQLLHPGLLEGKFEKVQQDID